jgi:exodeoxyribonuclease-3
MGGRGLNLGWRFDYMIIDKESIGIVEDSSIHKEYYGSDHCPIRLIIDLKKSKEQKGALQS